MKITSMLSVLVAPFVLIGCGGGGVGSEDRPETAPVTVTIAYNKTPVADATVTFSPKNLNQGKAAYGKTDSSGVVKLNAFTDVEGVVPGEYHVLVSKMEVVASQEDIPMDDPRYTGEPDTTPKAPPKSLIPEKYNAAATSKLEASVKAGQDNSFTFDLVD